MGKWIAMGAKNWPYLWFEHRNQIQFFRRSQIFTEWVKSPYPITHRGTNL
jgi:hypothetical protein